jgi:hypothetical protein
MSIQDFITARHHRLKAGQRSLWPLPRPRLGCARWCWTRLSRLILIKRNYAKALDDLFAFCASQPLSRSLINGVAGGHGVLVPFDDQCPALGRPQNGRRGPAERHDRIGGGGQPDRHPQQLVRREPGWGTGISGKGGKPSDTNSPLLRSRGEAVAACRVVSQHCSVRMPDTTLSAFECHSVPAIHPVRCQREHYGYACRRLRRVQSIGR